MLKLVRMAAAAPPAEDAALRLVFDMGHYRRVASIGPDEDAVAHYRARGDAAGLSPTPLFDPQWHLARVPEARSRGGTLLEDYLARGASVPLDPHPAFDAAWYAARAGISGDVLRHYLSEGWRDGLSPHPLFWPAHYARAALGTDAGAVEPLAHYLLGGWREAEPNPLFDGTSDGGGGPASPDPLTRYLREGAAGTRAPHPLIDPGFVAARLPPARGPRESVLERFLRAPGADVAPHPLFDPAFHAAGRPRGVPEPRDAPMRVGPSAAALIAYLSDAPDGREGADPHPLFSRRHYADHAGDVVAAGVDPLVHHVRWGHVECRSPHPLIDARALSEAAGGGDALARLALEGPAGRLPPRAPRPADTAERPLPPFRAVTPVPAGPPARAARDQSVGCFLHVFHADLLDELLDRVAHVPAPCTLFVTTDAVAKAHRIEARLAARAIHPWEVRVAPNRGRDIAPMLVGFADRLREVEVALHLHTKRSDHTPGGMADWRRHLLDGVAAGPGHVRHVLSMLADGAGAVVPDHHPSIRPLLQWGGNLDAARALMRMMGEDVPDGGALDFPSGSMFWARTDALAPLLDLRLAWELFEPEDGQTDGTLAHAIERCVLRVVEAAGHDWIVARPAPEAARLAPRRNRLFPSARDRGVAAAHMPQMGGFLARPSALDRPRLSLLVPTADRREGWAGIATALDLFHATVEALGPEVDARIIATDSSPGAGYAPPPGFDRADRWARDAPGRVVEDATDRGAVPVLVRPREAFLATAWWTAHHAFALEDARRAHHGGATIPSAYLVQDWEPGFHPASTASEFARATYLRPERTIPVFNSAPLHEAFAARGLLRDGLTLAPAAPRGFLDALAPGTGKERIVLLYARAHAERNALPFVDMLVAHLERADPEWRRWRFVAVGEDLPAGALRCGARIERAGRLSLAEYGALASRAALGVSLMIAPHPSYPPLEMAQAGVLTLSSAHEGRAPSRLHPNLRDLPVLDLDLAADAMAAMRAAWEADPQGGWRARPGVEWFFDGRGSLRRTAAALAAGLAERAGWEGPP